jgi:dephospho-CoA kinase
MIVIGITGTIGSGKGTIVKYLADKYGFKHYSARKLIAEEALRRGLPDDRDSLVKVAISLRKEFAPSYLAEQLYDRAKLQNQNAVIESVRNVAEVTALRNKPDKFYLIAIDADPQIRFNRISQRKSSTDNISFEKFLADEKREMANPDPAAMNISKCIDLADAHITNNDDLASLEHQIDEIMKLYLKTPQTN